MHVNAIGPEHWIAASTLFTVIVIVWKTAIATFLIYLFDNSNPLPSLDRQSQPPGTIVAASETPGHGKLLAGQLPRSWDLDQLHLKLWRILRNYWEFCWNLTTSSNLPASLHPSSSLELMLLAKDRNSFLRREVKVKVNGQGQYLGTQNWKFGHWCSFSFWCDFQVPCDLCTVASKNAVRMIQPSLMPPKPVCIFLILVLTSENHLLLWA